MTMIEVKNLSKNYGTVNALCDVSFALERGKILGLVGDNGAGKSTLLEILSGNVQPSAGEICIEGEITRFRGPADAMRKGIATAHQFLELVGTATAWENFFIGREQTRKMGPFVFLDINRMKRSAVEAIAKYGITFDIEKEVDDLSGEERQIIAVARSIDATPKILLLDESFTLLSLQGRERVLNFLRNVNEKDAVTMIIVSHDLDLVSELAHSIMVLRDGRRVFFGRTAEITVDEIVEYMLP